MIRVLPFADLGHADHGWLVTAHHFSFADYYDPRRMGFGPLRVWNDDVIKAHSGFPPHPHRDMEIITYVRSGAITHEDHLGHRGRTVAGDVQVMSAGTGIAHAEWNREDVDTLIFQIWIQPNRKGLPPRWETRQFPRESRSGQLQPVASGEEAHVRAGAAPIFADATLWAATLAPGQAVTHTFAGGRRGYLVSARGRVEVDGQVALARDGVEIEGQPAVTLRALEEAEVLLLDLP